MMTHEGWIDHIRSVVADPSASEFVDPISKTREIVGLLRPKTKPTPFTVERLEERTIPTVIIHDSSAEYLDPLGETCLALEMLFRLLCDDYDEFVFGEPIQATFDYVASTE